MRIDTLKKLYIAELKDMYNTEKQLTDALSRFRAAASNDKLAQAFDKHLHETQEQVSRIESIFDQYDEFDPTGERCEAMTGLIREADALMKNHDDKRVLDAALICAAQKIEHYEFGTYGTILTYARLLGDTKAAKEIEKSLNEEKQADRSLSELAESSINELAMTT